jgi:hypothetical protein
MCEGDERDLPFNNHTYQSPLPACSVVYTEDTKYSKEEANKSIYLYLLDLPSCVNDCKLFIPTYYFPLTEVT